MEIFDLKQKRVHLRRSGWPAIDDIKDYDIKTALVKLHFKKKSETMWYDKYHTYVCTLPGWSDRLTLRIAQIKNKDFKYQVYIENHVDKNKNIFANINDHADLNSIVKACYIEYFNAVQLAAKQK